MGGAVNVNVFCLYGLGGPVGVTTFEGQLTHCLDRVPLVLTTRCRRGGVARRYGLLHARNCGRGDGDGLRHGRMSGARAK